MLYSDMYSNTNDVLKHVFWPLQCAQTRILAIIMLDTYHDPPPHPHPPPRTAHLYSIQHLLQYHHQVSQPYPSGKAQKLNKAKVAVLVTYLDLLAGHRRGFPCHLRLVCTWLAGGWTGVSGRNVWLAGRLGSWWWSNDIDKVKTSEIIEAMMKTCK